MSCRSSLSFMPVSGVRGARLRGARTKELWDGNEDLVHDVDGRVRGLDIAADYSCVVHAVLAARLRRNDDRTEQRGQVLAAGQISGGLPAADDVKLHYLRQVGPTGQQGRQVAVAERGEGRILGSEDRDRLGRVKSAGQAGGLDGIR